MRVWNGLALALCGLGRTSSALAAGGHGDETNIFNADVGNFVFTLIIFGLVIYILGKFAWKPILKVLHEREQTIRESLVSAQHEREKAEALLADYQAQLDRARGEAAALLDKGRQDAEAVRQRLLDQARHETSALTARAKLDIERATDAALKELYDRTAELSVAVAGRIIGKELSATDHARLIADSVAEIRESDKARLN